MKKKLLSVLLVICMVLTLMPISALADFADTVGHWGKESIDRWAAEGVLNGKAEDTFDPDGKMTRAEFAQMLCNLMGYTKKAANTFVDVPDDAWYADAILKLVEAGVINGVGDNMAAPNAPITREQAAVMLCRAFDLKTSSTSMNYADAGDVSGWAKGAVATLTEMGMMSGVGENKVAPQMNINRASVAKLIDNMVADYVTESKTITGEVNGIVLVAAGVDVTIDEGATVNGSVVAAPGAEGAKVDNKGTVNGDMVTKAPDSEIKNEGAVNGDMLVDESAEGAKNDNSGTVSGDMVVEAPKAENKNSGDVSGDMVAAETADGAKNDNSGKVGGDMVVEAPKAENKNSGDVSGDMVVAETAEGAKNDNSGTVSGDMVAEAADAENNNSGKVEGDMTASDDAKNNNTGTVEGEVTGGDTTTPTPSSGGGSSSTTKSDVTITVSKEGSGDVTADTGLKFDLAEGEEETGKTVTLTLTPAEGYIAHKAYKVVDGEDVEVTITSGTVTLTGVKENTTVKVTFIKPITDWDLYVIDSKDKFKTFADKYHYSYTDEEYASLTDTDLKDNAWLAMGFTLNGAYESSYVAGNDITITNNGNAVDQNPFANNSLSHNYATAYFRPHTNGADSSADCLYTGNKSNADVSGTYKVSVTFQGATYEKTINYTAAPRSGSEETPVTLVDIKFDSETMKAQVGKTITVPSTPTTNSTTYYTGKWMKDGAVVDLGSTLTVTGAATYTSQKFTIGTTTPTQRPTEGKGSEPSDFRYAPAYTNAGISGTTTINVNGVKMMGKDAVAPQLINTVNGNDYVFYGLQFKPTVAAKKVVVADTVEGLDSGEPDEYDLTEDSDDALSGAYIHYIAVADVEGGELTLKTDDEFTFFFKWMDGDTVLAVTKATVKRVVEHPIKVTFKADGETVDTKYIKKSTTTTAPTVEGKEIYGWFDDDGNEFKTTTKFTVDTEFTAVVVTAQTATQRPAEGDIGEYDGDWDALYTAAGLSINEKKGEGVAEGTYTIEIDSDTWAEANDDVKAALKHGSNLYYGVQFTKAAGATSMKWADTLADLKNSTKVFDLTKESMSGNGDVVKGEYVEYYSVATEDGTASNKPGVARYFVWMKGDEVVSVTKVIIERVVVTDASGD